MPTTLLHVFPSFAIGGQQVRFATIANSLGRDFYHRLVSLDGEDGAASLLDRSLDFEILPRLGLSRPLQRFRDIARIIDGTNADVLITYNWGAIEWAIVNRWFYRRPHIHLEDGFGPDEVNRQKAHRVVARHFNLGRSVVVVPSLRLAKIAHDYWRLKSENVRYIPNGIDSTRFDVDCGDGAPYFHRSNGECIIGSFSPLRPEKNIGRLIRAFAELAKPHAAIRLIICGDGPERYQLVDLAEQLSVSSKIVFAGHVEQPESVLGAFDLFAITSDTEQMPYAVLEAMAARLPVVGTAVGDISVMVAEQNRPFIVERDNPRQLVEALAQLCENEELRRRLGDANRYQVEQSFPLAAMTNAFREIIMSVLVG